jgi:hypothetical protein
MNAAERLAKIHADLIAVPVSGQLPVSAAWGMALGLEYEGGSAEDEIALALHALRLEIRAVQARLIAANVPTHIFHSQYERLAEAASLPRMHVEWRGTIGNLTAPDVAIALGWAAVFLPQDESEVPSEELAAIGKAIDLLVYELEGADLPPWLKQYADAQLTTLRRALSLYPIKGSAALRRAVTDAAGAALAAKAEAAVSPGPSEEAKSYITRVNGLIDQTVHALDSTEKVHKGAVALVKLAEVAKIGWDWIIPG